MHLTPHALALVQAAGHRWPAMRARLPSSRARSCYERWDGTGYPDGLAGDDIPLAARVIFCSNAFQALVDDRPYSAAVSETVATHELWKEAGTQFDPRVVEALTRALRRRRVEDAERPAAAAERERVATLHAAG